MNKEETLTFLKGQLAAGIISAQDLAPLAPPPAYIPPGMPRPMSAPTAAAEIPEQGIAQMRLSITNALYGIGALIALAGVGTLIAQNWNDIGFAGRMLVTAGIAAATYLSGMLFGKKEQRVIAEVMFTIAAALAPVGVSVALDQAGMKFDFGVQAAIAAAFAAAFGGTYFLNRTRPILVPITAAFALWAYHAFIFKIFPPDVFRSFDVLRWTAMAAGASLLFVGYGYRPSDGGDSGLAREQRAVKRLFYAFGAFAVLASASSFGGVGDAVFIAVLFGAFYLSVYLQSRTMLVLGALFLIYHIMKLTGLYFAGSLGWPVALVVSGFLIIAAGYGTFYLNRTYFGKR